MSNPYQVCEHLAYAMRQAGFTTMPVVVPATRKDVAVQCNVAEEQEAAFMERLNEELTSPFTLLPDWFD